MIDKTMTFSVNEDKEAVLRQNLTTIYDALTEKGYYTYSMHGNFSSMWNRNNVHPAFGYQGLYYEETYEFISSFLFISVDILVKIMLNCQG